MNGRLYNNIGICSLGIAFTLQQIDKLSLSETLLIMPIITHDKLLQYMARKSNTFQSIEQIIVSKSECFSNFNDRFYDGLVVSINAIQLLEEIGIIKFDSGIIMSLENIKYERSMGKRASKIFNAAPRIAAIISNDNTKNLYTNLRIKL